MKIVISSYTFLPEIGGVATNVSILAGAFADAGHDVTLVTPTKGPVDGYRFTVVRQPGATQLIKLYRNADVLILSNLSLGLAWPLLLFPRDFALRHHSESAFQLTDSFTDRLRRKLRDRATHFTTSAYIGRISGLPKFEVTHPFASIEYVTDETKLPLSARSAIVYVGRIEEEKGVAWLLDRWPLLQKLTGETELRLVGSGSYDDQLRHRIKTENLSGVQVLGPKDKRQTAVEMGRARYIVVPSLWQEPFGAVALEGVAAGAIPIIADRGGLTETAGELGSYYDPDDDDSFSQAVSRAKALLDLQLQSPEKRVAWLEAVEQHLAKFEPGVVVEKIIRAMVQPAKA